MSDRSDPAEPSGPSSSGAPGRDADVITSRASEASGRDAPRLPLDLAGTFLVGFGMGSADLVPGFSGGTVALVAGIYERLIANVRQGAHVLSLLLRARVGEAGRAFGRIEWGFVVALLSGILSAVVALASWLSAAPRDPPGPDVRGVLRPGRSARPSSRSPSCAPRPGGTSVWVPWSPR